MHVCVEGEGSVAGGGPGPSAGPAGAMHRPAEVVEPDGVCVRAVFGLRRALGRSSSKYCTVCIAHAYNVHTL